MKRPHWDAELEQSVSAILFDCYNNGVSEEQVYQIIAAVEDWHRERVDDLSVVDIIWCKARLAQAEADRDRLANQLLNEVPDSYIQMKARALTAESAIARVREVCAAPPPGDVPDYATGWRHALAAVRHTLDGAR